MSSFELAAYRPEHREDYLRLLRQAWGEEALSPLEFDWWFAANPAGSLMSVAYQRGRVVGVAAHSLARMVLAGEERLVSFSVHATTHPSARGQGIFAALERRHEELAAERGVACALAFASPPTIPIFLGPLGWSEIGRLRIWARPLLGGGAAHGGHDELAVEGDAAASWPNHVIRDARYLRWRYLASPRGYLVLRSPGGYAVVWPSKRHRGRRIAVLADLVAPPREIPSLLERAARAARARLLFALPGREERRSFLAAGFVPTPLSLRLVGKSLAFPLERDPAAWRFTLGDTDFF
jgi:GNAT superfamily N-acetyltransferase